jgi:hypothetical protein
MYRTLTKADLLILDDWGPDRLSANQRRDLMEIVEDRYGAGSTLITGARADVPRAPVRSGLGAIQGLTFLRGWPDDGDHANRRTETARDSARRTRRQAARLRG